jgi:hypothetical protein
VEEPTTRQPLVTVPLHRDAAPVVAPIVSRIMRVAAPAVVVDAPRGRQSIDVSTFQSVI